jgi:hypothetical protein
MTHSVNLKVKVGLLNGLYNPNSDFRYKAPGVPYDIGTKTLKFRLFLNQKVGFNEFLIKATQAFFPRKKNFLFFN